MKNNLDGSARNNQAPPLTVDDFAASLINRAKAARAQADFVTAAEAYERALTLDPADAEIRLQYGQMSLERGNLATAEQQFIQARALRPFDGQLHYLLGKLFKAQGRRDEAVSSFRVSERLSPGWSPPVAELAELGADPIRPPDRARPPNAAAPRPVGKPTRPPPPRLFDAQYYLENCPEAAASGVEPWEHYLREGAAAGYNPHFLFDTAYYQSRNPDLQGENPFVHFLRVGWRERRPFHWLFSLDLYLHHNPDLASTGDLLGHFLTYGLRENRRPHTLFDPEYYFASYGDLTRTGMAAFEHFLRYGDREGRAPHALFDPKHYRAQAADLERGTGVLKHYVVQNPRGNPHPFFDTRFYLQQCPDLDPFRTSPLQHYLDTGAVHGIPQHPLFEPSFYLAQTGDLAARRCPLLHYIDTGAAAGLSPHPLFDPDHYRKQVSGRSWTGAILPKTGPCISVLVPVYNTPPDVLQKCIESVRNQSYASWELCLIDDASQNAATVAMLERYRGTDKRIKIVRSARNLHIARATNLVAEQATGEFLAFLDHDDTITAEALAEVALAVSSRPDVDLLYTDEDKIDAADRHSEPYYKPDWSPDHLMSVMYLLHFLVIRKALFWKLGGLRAERTGAQDYDLALRAGQQARHVHHIPRILYHWRMIPGSAAATVDAKPYALEAARLAVHDAVEAAGMQATVEDGLLPGTFRVRYSLAADPPVTLLVFTNNGQRDVPGRGRINLLRHFLRSIAEKTTYRNVRLVVVDNANTPPETRKLIKELRGKIVPFTPGASFSYAEKANFATASVQTEHVIYLNDDLEVISPGWIEALLEPLQVPSVGGVGARLLYPDDRLQHSGVVLGVHGGVGHAFWGLPSSQIGYAGYTHLIRNFSAVSGAVFATRKSTMDEVGGFDQSLRIDYNDLDLCLRMARHGYRTVFTPYCELYHFEGSTQIRTTQAPEEIALFHARWQKLIDADPLYNRNLPRDHFGFDPAPRHA